MVCGPNLDLIKPISFFLWDQFVHRTVRDWNELPATVAEAGSLGRVQEPACGAVPVSCCPTYLRIAP